MKLAKMTRNLVPPSKESKSNETPVPRKKGRTINNPEQTPQEPKGRVNTRDAIRQQRVGFQHNTTKNNSGKR
jgi:hypothetical protein